MRTLRWVRQLKHKTQPHSNTCLRFALRLALLHLTEGCWALGSCPVCWNLLRISARWVSSKTDKTLKQSHAVCRVRAQAWASKSYQVMPKTTSPFSPGGMTWHSWTNKYLGLWLRRAVVFPSFTGTWDHMWEHKKIKSQLQASERSSWKLQWML